MKKTSPGPDTLLPLLRAIYKRFKKARVFNPYVTAEVIVSEALGIPRAEIYLSPEKKLPAAEREKILRWAKKREQRMPLSYVLGKTWFREIDLEITPAVLVPRQETELLVDEAIRLIFAESKFAKILDLGTGSGAIILSLACELKGLKRKLQFFASDLSAPALKLARKNARKLGLDKKIVFRRGDLFEPWTKQKFDLIVCNPPYITQNGLTKLMPEVSKYEPRIALDGGKQGLDVIKRLLAQAPKHLNPSGFLLLEIGKGQSGRLARLDTPGLNLQGFIKDYSQIDRIAIFQYRA